MACKDVREREVMGPDVKGDLISARKGETASSGVTWVISVGQSHVTWVPRRLILTPAFTKHPPQVDEAPHEVPLFSIPALAPSRFRGRNEARTAASPSFLIGLQIRR